jgi:hypothetical protein
MTVQKKLDMKTTRIIPNNITNRFFEKPKIQAFSGSLGKKRSDNKQINPTANEIKKYSFKLIFPKTSFIYISMVSAKKFSSYTTRTPAPKSLICPFLGIQLIDPV